MKEHFSVKATGAPLDNIGFPTGQKGVSFSPSDLQPGQGYFPFVVQVYVRQKK